MQKRLEDWLNRLKPRELPIMHSTVAALERLAGPEGDDLGVSDLHPLVVRDPALSLNLLRAANSHQHRHLDTRITTVDHAVLMLGVTRTLRLALAYPIADETLPDGHGQAYYHALANARLIANFAEAWANIRKDVLPGEVFAAALARQSGDLTLRSDPAGCERMREADELGSRSGVRQRECEYVILGFTAADLSMSLKMSWQLPTLTMEYVLPENIGSRRTLGIRLATELVAIGQRGWTASGMGHLLHCLENYLGTDRETAIETIPPIAHAVLDAFRLSTAPSWGPLTSHEETPAPPLPERSFCLAPRHDLFYRLLDELSTGQLERITKELRNRHEHLDTEATELTLAARAVHYGLGMNRTVLFRLNKDEDQLKPYLALGAETDPLLVAASVDVDARWLDTFLPSDSPPIRIRAGESSELREQLQAHGGPLFDMPDYLVQAVRGPKGAIGMFFVDRPAPACPMPDGAIRDFSDAISTLEAALRGS